MNMKLTGLLKKEIIKWMPIFQWDLVCEHKSLNQATATYFFFGVMFGAVIFGDLSDR